MSRSWAGGSTRRWRAIRAEVLADNRRDNEGKCTLQLDGCEGDANSVHHLLGKAAGDDRKYLVACCGHCNSSVGDPMKNERPIRRISSW